MEKLDLYKGHKDEYVTPKKPVVVTVGPAKYLAIEDRGMPGGPEFVAAMEGLYTIAHTLKFASKEAGKDYVVAKPEGLYDPKDRQGKKQPKRPRWKLLVRVPDFITQRDLTKAQKAIAAKGKAARAQDVKLETIREGKCVQMLHVGPYEQVTETINRMLAFAQE